jgi:hypothetical protein
MACIWPKQIVQAGELRIIDLAELNRWHDLLTRLVADS